MSNYGTLRDREQALVGPGKPCAATFPDFRTGHDMMCVIDAAVRADKAGRWVKVER